MALLGGSVGIGVAVLALSVSLQGCANSHHEATWRMTPSYLTDFQFIAPGMQESQAVLNSCELPGLDDRLKCSGNGFCKVYRDSLSGMPIQFCQCYRDWADPECRTRRKSQAVTFVLSLFLGFLGADHFYISEPITGALKLATLGGFGAWWVLDIVRFGAAPVYASKYRLAYDLPHWAFVFVSLLFFTLLGLVLFTLVANSLRSRRKMNRMLLDAEDEYHKTRSATLITDPLESAGRPTLSSRGNPFPVRPHYGSTSEEYAVVGAVDHPFSPIASYQNGMRQAAMHRRGMD